MITISVPSEKLKGKAINQLNEEIKPLYTSQRQEMSLKDINTKFFTRIFTSWLVPFSVKFNNLDSKSILFFVSSIVSTMLYIVGLFSLWFDSKKPDSNCPPSLHCVESGNQSVR